MVDFQFALIRMVHGIANAADEMNIGRRDQHGVVLVFDRHDSLGRVGPNADRILWGAGIGQSLA